jgi:hypothetical protein
MAVKIFFCYAHEDEDLLKQLKMHLRPLEKQGLIELWYDRDISPGTQWKDEIDKRLNLAQIILLLISRHFMGSDYCYSIEMQKAIKLHKLGKTTVIPVILRHVDWQGGPLAELQALPTDAIPVTDRTWQDTDEAFLNVTRSIRKKVEELLAIEVETKKKQLALKLFEKQFTDACLTDDDQTIIAAYNTIQASVYAEYYSPDQRLLNRLESAQIRVAALAALQTNYAQKNSLDAGRKFKQIRDIFKYIMPNPVIRVCPSCITEFYPGDCRILSGKTWGKVLKSAPRSRVYPEPLTGSYYIQELAHRECPHCRYLLPYNIEHAENVNIVVFGNIVSGKVTYLTALLHEIRMKWIPKNKGYMRLNCLTEDAENSFDQGCTYPLFGRKSVLPLIRQSVSKFYTPLIYELKLNISPSLPAKIVNLIFYHGAGEDYMNQSRFVEYCCYVFNASGIIYLADPFFIPEIRDQLGSHMQSAFIEQNASDSLSMLVQLFERQFGTEPESRLFSMPIAIMLAKSDVLKQLKSLKNRPYQFLQNPKNGYSGSVDLQDLKVVDGEVKELIREHVDPMFLTLASRLNAQFFATSATGCAPDISGHYPTVEPLRCLDPFLWILYQLNILQGDGDQGDRV